ncbi:sperm-associated antigen 11A-like [Peromyscus californicus insignis]|uniref:sperm-associated antigen 11A-like n=1 Tax=Peromyscus californicus insignis TaxID=564181 RepID=UPI0022A8070A|nr:sperm-associated antigen 11A-like [Peromyscus californicus insignis]
MKILLLFAVFLWVVRENSGDIPPGIRNTICLMQKGHCRLFRCRFGEKKGDICSDPWNRCCIPISLNNGDR